MSNLISNFQDRVKTSSNALALLGFRVLTGAYIGLTLALVGDEIIQYGWFSFTLVILATTGAVLKITRPWSWVQLLIFNLFCILVGLVLRMYILIAPG